MASYGIPITLSLPVDGQVSWSGPLNAILQAIIDVIGTRVTVDGIDIAASLEMNGQALVDARNISFIPGGDTGTVNSVFYSTDGELYLRDGANRLVQVTAGGVLNVGGTGGFGGDYVSTNQNGASYTNSNQTFTFTAAGGTVFAPMESGRLIVHESGATAVTLRSPSSLTSYTLTLPNNVPQGARAVVTADATGSLAFSLSASFTESLPIQAGNAGTDDPDAFYQGGIWNLGSSVAVNVDFGIPYTFGDRIDAVQFGTAGNATTGTLYHVSNTGNRVMIARKAFNGGGPGLQTLQAGAHTMTGTLPYTPPGTGSLYIQIGNAPSTSESINSVLIIRNRKLIS